MWHVLAENKETFDSNLCVWQSVSSNKYLQNSFIEVKDS